MPSPDNLAPLENGGRRQLPIALSATAAAVVVALLLTAFNLDAAFPGLAWRALVRHAGMGELPAVIALYSALPRIAVALLCGMGLALSGTLFQQILRNPLAEPSTLGVSSGAYLAVVASAIFWPGLLLAGKFAIAIAGAGTAIALVLAASWRQALSPVAVSLAGMTLNLVFGSLASILVTFHRDGFVSLSFWGSGSLRQNDWSVTGWLALGMLPALLALVPSARALTLFNLKDEAASSLGADIRRLRLIGLGLATWLAAVIVAGIGMIGFIGLAAPWLARRLGAAGLANRLWLSALFGAALLLLADQTLIALGSFARALPAGAFTACLGAPLLFWLLRKPLPMAMPPAGTPASMATGGHRARTTLLMIGIGLIIALSATVTADAGGWRLPDMREFATAFPWRWPRIVGAGAGGAALALAGAILQRMTGNAMASPEALGISSGTLIGAALALFVLPAGFAAGPMLGGIAGAAAAFGLIVSIGRRSGLSSNRMLLVGIGFGSVLSAVSGLLALLPDPRLQSLQTWMLGSTSLVSPDAALLTLAGTCAGLVAALLTARWLDILPLGGAASLSLGIALPARLCLLLLTCALSAIASLTIGPLSFVGLMAPHMVRAMGMRHARAHLKLSALLGCGIMILADAAGRLLVFPYEIPAGLLASLAGGPYLIWAFRHR